MAVGRSGPLGWGQRYIWLRHEHMPPEFRAESHIVLRFPLPDGSTATQVQAMINYLVRRHEALRTTVHHDADDDPRQQVHPPAPLRLPVVATERTDGPGAVGVVAELSSRPFDLAEEWPVRGCVLTRAGVATHLVLVLHHMAFDAWSLARFEQEVESLGVAVLAGRPTALEPVRHQPLDLVRYESSAESRPAQGRALAYWGAEAARLPPDPFRARRRNDVPRVGREVALTSPALLAATRQIAERHRVWPSMVHVAAYTAVMAAYTRTRQIPHLSFTGNRGSLPCPEVMTCAFTPLLINVDCRDEPTFLQLLRRVADHVEEAGAHGHLPYDRAVEQLPRIGSELSFLSHATTDSRARRTTFARRPAPEAWAAYGTDTFFRIYELRDAVMLCLDAVSTVMGPEDMERFVRGHEELVRGHLDPAVDRSLAEVADGLGFSEPAAPALPAAVAAAAPDERAVTALTAVVARVNGLDDVPASSGYVTAGGRVLRIPRVLALLNEHGWCGLTVNQLAGDQPLRVLAASARRLSPPPRPR